MKRIYLAGGCYWGIEAYFRQMPWILDIKVGFASHIKSNQNVDYFNLNQFLDYRETVEISYNDEALSLQTLIERFFDVIDPLDFGGQANDRGHQYKTAIFVLDENDLNIVKYCKNKLSQVLNADIATKIYVLMDFQEALEDHQNYLAKNPNGYCHIRIDKNKKWPLIDKNLYPKPSEEQLQKRLSQISYNVTQKDATEKPFSGKYTDLDQVGVYVDIVSNEPLFLSTNKYHSGCGWPSFSKPIDQFVINEKEDLSLTGRPRVEVRSNGANSHLGHVFTDGLKELGGLRYCINSASLRFIPKNKMKEEGLGYLISFLK